MSENYEGEIFWEKKEGQKKFKEKNKIKNKEWKRCKGKREKEKREEKRKKPSPPIFSFSTKLADQPPSHKQPWTTNYAPSSLIVNIHALKERNIPREREEKGEGKRKRKRLWTTTHQRSTSCTTHKLLHIWCHQRNHLKSERNYEKESQSSRDRKWPKLKVP